MSSTFMRRADAAKYLQIKCGTFTAGTLAKLACVGGGPAFRKMGRFPVYVREDLDLWLDNRLSDLVTNTVRKCHAPRRHEHLAEVA